jgi:hypothetical protein
MNLMFWKKKADIGGDAENPADKMVVHEALSSESLEKPGLVAKIKSQLAALIRRFKKSPALNAAEAQAPDATGHSESTTEDITPSGPVNLKKRLIIGGAIGLFVLLLAGIGVAAWKFFAPQPKHDATAPASAEPPHTAQPTPHAAIPHAETEALRKKNEELQAQIEALKKQPLQQMPAEPAAQQESDNIPPLPVSGERTIDNKDPKAAAMSLKEAIEAMNAGSESPDKNDSK